MRNNRYTETVDKIKAPEGAVENALEAARNHETESVVRTAANAAPAKKAVSRRLAAVRYAVAAALALVVALGAILGPNLFGKKTGNAFSLTVHAAELEKGQPVYIETGSGSMNVIGRGDNGKGSVPGIGGTEYYVALPFTVSGENVARVTYTADKDAIAVIFAGGSDPVTAGNKVGEGLDTVFDQYYLNQAEKAGKAADAAVSRKYSSVTLTAAGQAADGFAMGLVGESDKDSSEFYAKDDKTNPSGNALEERAARLNELVGTVIHCSVSFSDGSIQQLDIQVGFAVMQASAADPDAFAKLTAEEKAAKDYTGIFVTYSIAE